MRNKRLRKLNKLLFENREFLHHTDKDNFYMIYKKYNSWEDKEMIYIDNIKYRNAFNFDNNYQLNKWLDEQINQVQMHIEINKTFNK